ncbi:MAG: flagellar basal-body MS-ring/collar protein FliF [Candidatus Eisenbacteria bacterium]
MAQDPRSMLSSVSAMSAPRRVALLAGLAVAVVGVWLVARWAAAPTYVTLYRELDLREASSLHEHLEKANVEHRLGDGGSSIEVPTAEAARARVALAKDGLPSSGRPGLELFDKPSMMMTDFTERVTYQRALEGELARTIASIQGIQRAEVHLLIPATSPLRRSERASGASVVLTLQANGTLTPETVQGITYIVSNSVENLSSENVAIMDNSGRVLSAPAAAGSTEGLTSRQLEVQRGLEGRLVAKIEDLLTGIVGPGHVRAEVGAQMSFDQTDQTVETFNPEGQVLQSEQRSETGEGGGVEGASDNAQTIVSNTYLNSRKLEKTTGSSGRVERLTVAVLVDQKTLAESGQGGSPPLNLGAIEALVRNVIAADSTRGDRVSVMAVPLTLSPVASGAAGGVASDGVKMDPMRMVDQVGRPLVNVVAILALAFLAWRGAALLGVGAGVGAAVGVATNGNAPVSTNGLQDGAAPSRNRLAAELSDRPETTAHVVRGWIAEDGS